MDGNSDNSPGRMFLGVRGTATTLTSSVRMVYVWAGDGSTLYDPIIANVSIFR
jgi:hypothetical protein